MSKKLDDLATTVEDINARLRMHEYLGAQLLLRLTIAQESPREFCNNVLDNVRLGLLRGAEAATKADDKPTAQMHMDAVGFLDNFERSIAVALNDLVPAQKN